MNQPLKDYSHDPRVRFWHRVAGVRYLPVPWSDKIARLVGMMARLPRPEGPCLVTTRHGLKMRVDPAHDRGVERLLFRTGAYEEGTLEAMRVLLEGCDLFIDVGANVGLMSLFASKLMGEDGRVVAFEAMPATYEIFKANIGVNDAEGVTPGNITAENRAIGSAPGTTVVYDGASVNRGASSLIKRDGFGEGSEVAMTTLDEYLASHGLDAGAACVKIDVEGWELEVLRGAEETLARDDGPSCIIECIDTVPMQGGDTTEMFELLSGRFGYRVFRLTRTKDRPSKLREVLSPAQLPKHDNLFCMKPRRVEQLPTEAFAGGSTRLSHAA